MLGYNRMTGYNKARYNAEGTEIAAADTLSIVGATALKTFSTTLGDLVITSDDTAKQQNKAVVETIKLDIWLRETRDDSGLWGDA